MDPAFNESYNEKQAAHAPPLPVAGDDFHHAYATGWVHMNQGGETVIEIDIDQEKIYSGGNVIPNVQTLPSGKMLAISLDGESHSKFCMSKDMEFLYSLGGSTWQRRRYFKISWSKAHEGSQPQPLPFQDDTAIFEDTARSIIRWS